MSYIGSSNLWNAPGRMQLQMWQCTCSKVDSTGYIFRTEYQEGGIVPIIVHKNLNAIPCIQDAKCISVTYNLLLLLLHWEKNQKYHPCMCVVWVFCLFFVAKISTQEVTFMWFYLKELRKGNLSSFGDLYYIIRNTFIRKSTVINLRHVY